ncbi:hypothetical protein GCM10008957_27970 [Deinococcus ruber]|uniref:Uncharacterized protein n=1 Tax=Deinococcus ruber TaxID=1848197 RepID=A0A918CBW9_9DEIO|nr:hypothetical protein GCM10008957_27970 [Deinococcus ruber]
MWEDTTAQQCFTQGHLRLILRVRLRLRHLIPFEILPRHERANAIKVQGRNYGNSGTAMRSGRLDVGGSSNLRAAELAT